MLTERYRVSLCCNVAFADVDAAAGVVIIIACLLAAGVVAVLFVANYCFWKWAMGD